MIPHPHRHRQFTYVWAFLLALMGCAGWGTLSAQPLPTDTTFRYADVDGDGKPDVSLKRIEDRWPGPPFQPPVSWRVQWILEPIGATALVRLDGTVGPGSVIRTTDGVGQTQVPSLLILDAQWRAQDSPTDTTWGNSTVGLVIDAQVQGRVSAYAGIRVGTNGTPRTGWVRFATGSFPYTTNWPKEYLYSFGPFTWGTAIAETMLAPDASAAIRIGQGPGDGLHIRRRAFDWVLEVPDADSALRLETSPNPSGPWTPAKTGWELNLSVLPASPLDESRNRYYRVRP